MFFEERRKKSVEALHKGASGRVFTDMISCGYPARMWVETAFEYLPVSTFRELQDSVVVYCMNDKDGCRLPRAYCERREIIIISERIVPPKGSAEDNRYARYFIHTVLHEIAHAYRKHRSPFLDQLTSEEVKEQEDEAENLATRWFNDYMASRNSTSFRPISAATAGERWTHPLPVIGPT